MKPRRNKAEAKILVEAPRGVLEIMVKSLRPELESNITDRSKALIEASERGLILKVEAEDVTALRAAVNSYLYWINGIIDIGSRISP